MLDDMLEGGLKILKRNVVNTSGRTQKKFKQTAESFLNTCALYLEMKFVGVIVAHLLIASTLHLRLVRQNQLKSSHYRRHLVSNYSRNDEL